MFRVLDTRTGELAISLDYYTADQLDKAFRVAGKEGKLLCPTCRSTVVLRHDFALVPHFLHSSDSDCPHANENIRLLTARAALYRHLKREFGHGVTTEHDIDDPAIPRSVDCWVEEKGRKIAYWIFDGEIKSHSKRVKLRTAIQNNGASCQFVFTERMLKPIGDGSGTVLLGETEKFAKVCTPYDVLDGKVEGGSLHYITTEGNNPVLVSYRTLLQEVETGLFRGVRKKTPLADTEVCNHSGFLIHPMEKSHAEILRTRKAREKLEDEMSPDDPIALKWKKWELETRKLARSNESVSQIIARILRPRPDLQSVPLQRDREAPCEFCGVVTRDWIVFTGKTGKCKCRICYERISAEKRKVIRPSTWKSDDGSVA